jgi:hypothetical protein
MMEGTDPMISSDRQRERWRAEFEALGRARVRSEVMFGRLPPEKRIFAREWLERQDVEDWQARKSSGGGLGKLRINPKIWGLIGGLIFGGFAVYRVVRQLKAGF